MTAPKRWSDAGDGSTEVEQMLVRSGQDSPMPSAQKQAVWSQIQSALPPAALLPAPSSPSQLLAMPVVKALCLVVALSGLVAGGYHVFVPKRSAAPIDGLPVVASVLVAPPTVPLPSLVQSSAVSPEATLPASATSHAPLPSRASQLREESLAVIAARQALRNNDANGALRLLERAQQQFKKGALLEEREALTIQALAKSGRVTQAAGRAKAFMNSYPRSPHAADVQRYLAE
jgi:hypothetical protein